MRYYLDTNIVLFYIQNKSELTKEVEEILDDYSNYIYISSEVVKELVYLQQCGKVNIKGLKNEAQIFDFITNETNFEVKYVKKEHITTFAELPVFDDHKDPFDRIIVSHALTENIPIISSDKKFIYYIPSGLEFIYNKR